MNVKFFLVGGEFLNLRVGWWFNDFVFGVFRGYFLESLSVWGEGVGKVGSEWVGMWVLKVCMYWFCFFGVEICWVVSRVGGSGGVVVFFVEVEGCVCEVWGVW